MSTSGTYVLNLYMADGPNHEVFLKKKIRERKMAATSSPYASGLLVNGTTEKSNVAVPSNSNGT